MTSFTTIFTGYRVLRHTSQVGELIRNAQNNGGWPLSLRRFYLICGALIAGMDISSSVYRLPPLRLVEMGLRVVNLSIGMALLGGGQRDPLLQADIVLNALNISRIAIVLFSTLGLSMAPPLIVPIAVLDLTVRSHIWLH